MVSINQLIVTRPKQQAKSILAQLEGLVRPKVSVKSLPLITIDFQAFDPQLIGQSTHIIFVSSNAVRGVALSDHPILPQHHLFAIGENTAQSVEAAFGKLPIYPTKMNAEGLLALPELTNVVGQSWLIIKGKGGRPILAQTLQSRGASVNQLDVYQRNLPSQPDRQAIQSQLEDKKSISTAWIISSGEALSNLHSIVKQTNSDALPNLVVTSDRIAEQARQLNFPVLSQSTGASEQQLLQWAKSFFNLDNSNNE